MQEDEAMRRRRIIQNDWRLPPRLTIQIFLRLPLKKLVQLKLVSIKWYSLLSTSRFAKYLVQLSTPQTLIFQTHNCISCLKFNTTTSDDDIFTRKVLNTTILQPPLPRTTVVGMGYYCAGSYNGVVCIHLTTPELHQRIFLWNQFTRECRPIPLPPMFDDDRPRDLASHYQKIYWFGYVDLLDDVIIFHLKRKQSFVYSMKSDNWRASRNSFQFEIESETMPGRCSGTRFVLKNGALYYDLGLDSLLKFDLVNETCARLPFIQHLNGRYVNYEKSYNIIGSALGVTPENGLCSGRILEESTTEEWILDIWVWVEGLNNSGYWKSLCTTCLGKDKPGFYPWVFGFTCDGKMFVGARKLLMVDPKQVSGFNVKEVETKHTATYTASYFETLLSPYYVVP